MYKFVVSSVLFLLSPVLFAYEACSPATYNSQYQTVEIKNIAYAENMDIVENEGQKYKSLLLVSAPFSQGEYVVVDWYEGYKESGSSLNCRQNTYNPNTKILSVPEVVSDSGRGKWSINLRAMELNINRYKYMTDHPEPLGSFKLINVWSHPREAR